MGLFLGYLSQILIVALGVWAVGAFIVLVRMIWVDWRRASRRYRLGLGPSPFAYTSADFFYVPLGWPLAAWKWLDEHMDQLFEDLD